MLQNLADVREMPGNWPEVGDVSGKKCHEEKCLLPTSHLVTLGRARFTLSGALFRKKCGALHLEKTGDFCFSHHRPSACQLPVLLKNCSLLSFTRRLPIISGMQKICRSFCGAPLLWGPLFGRTCWTCLNLLLTLGPCLVVVAHGLMVGRTCWHAHKFH